MNKRENEETVASMNKIGYQHTVVTGGLWKHKQKMVRDTTVYAVYERFKETGRIDAFKCDWKEGMPHRPHIFWDSDVAKWIEGVAYLTKLKKEPKLERLADKIIDNIEKNQGDDGYFNIYYTAVEPEKRYTDRSCHELYCAGHLIEAAVAYYEATGKRKLLDCMCRYADHIEKRFKIDRDTAFVTPGHEEIELALVRLYDCTGEERYLELAEFFIDERGKRQEKPTDWSNSLYDQSHKPVREQYEAQGHAVRAVYLYCGMADIALKTGDVELRRACERLFDDIINKKMYITGGIGSSSCGEAFTVAFDLSNLLAYTESCAALGLALFANRMLRLDPDSKYANTIERIIYNGFLSSVSLDGKAFFYENPLEIIPYLHTRDVSRTHHSMHWPQMQRSQVFSCSCCPPNIVRFISSLADLLYTDDGHTLYVHQYMQSKTVIDRKGTQICIEQKTRFPESGKVCITVTGADTRIAVRIPDWCENYTGETVKGYAYFDVKDGESLSFDFGMKVRLIEARPEAVFDCRRYAVMKGPVVYCMESVDNGAYLRDICIDGRARFITDRDVSLGVPVLRVRAYRRKYDKDAPLYSVKHDSDIVTQAKLIPYYAFANRGVCEMQVWHAVK